MSTDSLKWRIKAIRSKKGSWDLNPSIKESKLRFEGGITINSNSKLDRVTSARQEVTATFYNEETTEELGSISIVSELIIDCDVPLEEFNANLNLRRQLSEEVSQVLSGYTRTRFAEIAAGAGMSGQVILPIQVLEYDSEQVKDLPKKPPTNRRAKKASSKPE